MTEDQTPYKLTAGDCQSQKLLFYPRSLEEAAAIQRGLFRLGIGWGQGAKVQALAECVQKGMIVLEGRLFYNPSAENRSEGKVCTLDQLPRTAPVDVMQYLQGDDLQREIFNRLSARMDKLEQMVAEIHAAVMPHPALPKPAALKGKNAPEGKAP